MLFNKRSFKIKNTNVLIFLFIPILILFSNCSTKKDSVKMVVVYAGSDSQYERAGQTLALERGILLGEKDVIITGNKGVVDLQATNGSLVRIQKFSRIAITNLGKKTRLDVDQGALMARIEKRDADQEFEVRSPTLVAGVRGTTFKVDTDGVKVLSGKVALKPRIKALESKTQAEINADPALKELTKSTASKEQILTKGQSGSMSEQTVAKIDLINTTVEKNKQGDLNQNLTNIDIIKVESNTVDLKDKADDATLVGIDQNLLVKVANQEKTQNTQESDSKPTSTSKEYKNQVTMVLKELETQYNQKRDDALDKLDKELFSEIKLTNDADIRKHYEVIESVFLHDNQKIIGAVVAQAGGILVIHAKVGLKRVPITSVNYIDYN